MQSLLLEILFDLDCFISNIEFFFSRILSSRCLARLLTVGHSGDENENTSFSSSCSSSASCSSEESSSEILRILLPNCLSPSLSKRHGAVLGLSEIILSTSMNCKYTVRDSSIHNAFSGLKFFIFINFIYFPYWSTLVEIVSYLYYWFSCFTLETMFLSLPLCFYYHSNHHILFITVRSVMMTLWQSSESSIENDIHATILQINFLSCLKVSFRWLPPFDLRFSHFLLSLFTYFYLFIYLNIFIFDSVDDLSTEIINLVPKIDKARLYRGKGGELFRQASCFLLENISRCHFIVPVKLQLTLLDLLNENLKQPHAQLRIAAASALRWCDLLSCVLM